MATQEPGTLFGPGATHVLAGPTAAGKSDVAHCLALRHGAYILSADAMQVYRGMDVGTAKPDASSRREVVYGGIDLVDATQPFSLWPFIRTARRFLDAAHAAGAPLFVVGGSGLYIKCLTEGLRASPPADAGLREEWDRALAEGGLPELQAAVRSVAAEHFDAMSLSDRANPRRLIRALERAADEKGSENTWKPDAEMPVLAGLERDAKQLKTRIRQRAEAMFNNGLAEEVECLMALGLDSKSTALQAIGYGEALAWRSGELTEADAIEKTASRTWRLARKQMTWFRHQANVAWVAAAESESTEELADRVEACWRGAGPVSLIAP